VGEVRGNGLLGAVEFVRSTDPLTAFDPALKVSAAVVRRSRELGVISRALPASDTIAFSPPFVVTEAEIDEMAAVARRALDDVAAELRLLP
jgi:L-2,4-diaminobutyrate transaminase